MFVGCEANKILLGGQSIKGKSLLWHLVPSVCKNAQEKKKSEIKDKEETSQTLIKDYGEADE